MSWVPAAMRAERLERRQAAMRARVPAQRVDRDPCWRCQVRGDVGCAHRPRADSS